MGTLYSLGDSAGRPRRQIGFSRTELRQLMDFYSRRVANGEWRDYAIDQGQDRAVFSVFRHTADRPLFVIEKLPSGDRQYRLTSGRRQLKQARTIAEVLAALDKRPRPIQLGA